MSTRLDYSDLGGLVGLPPVKEPPSARTAAQNKAAVKQELSGRVLPTTPYEVDKFRIIDAKVRFKAKRFLASKLPFDNMDATIELKDAVLKMQPLDFGIAGGHLAAKPTLDAREKLIAVDADVTARNIELSQIMPEIKPPKGSAGKVGGRARFTAKGNSVADMLARVTAKSR